MRTYLKYRYAEQRKREYWLGSIPREFHPPTPSATTSKFSEAKNESYPPLCAFSGWGIMKALIEWFIILLFELIFFWVDINKKNEKK